MLTALEKGVKGGKWFSLMDKVYSKPNLLSSFEKVRRNGGSAGADHQRIEQFEKKLEENLDELHSKLKEDKYHPQPVKRVWIPKPGSREKRPLGIPTVRDRVVQTALRNVLEPIFERDFAKHSYGFRPGRNCKQALSRVWKLLKEGYIFVVDARRENMTTLSHSTTFVMRCSLERR
jgi:RNA-directed DNA polymerase